MSAKVKTAITPVRSENYPEWYQQVVKAADLAEASPVRGCMIIKPWGCALWEQCQRVLDGMFKDTGHRNAYFPLFIPKRFLEKEAEHVEGFAKECAVVTHHRLEAGPDGGLVPAGELDEPLVVRPTSETIIGEAFSRWIESYRDLPLLINQWANVVRWEMRTRLFLRTAEFLWQEGHTAHATSEEAVEHTRRMLDVYADFCDNWMAMPVLRGRKTEAERFPGADDTLCIEAMMQDRKALQAGTSHFLGQNFSRAQDIVYLNDQGERVHCWTTSWGVSTRLIGGLIMTHSDDDGLVLPPRLAPAHVVILPITFKADDPEAVMEYCRTLARDLRGIRYAGRTIEVEIDDRDIRGGEKTWSWVKKGVPIRLEVGPRDMAEDSVFMARRDRPAKEKESVARVRFLEEVVSMLEEMQQGLYDRALAHREDHTREIDTREEFTEWFTAPDGDPTPIHAGFAMTHFCGDRALEEQIKSELGVTVLCEPIDDDPEPGTCPFSGKPSPRRVVWGKSY
ncbi:MAG TPA: proline--tRNA ligase [Phycisphaerales bacterium]|nr:proline--tRNA ligase [Phycisphaerales bacterium]